LSHFRAFSGIWISRIEYDSPLVYDFPKHHSLEMPVDHGLWAVCLPRASRVMPITLSPSITRRPQDTPEVMSENLNYRSQIGWSLSAAIIAS